MTEQHPENDKKLDEQGDAQMADASDDSDSSSSESDFQELTISPEDTQMLMKLELALQANPNLYDSHVQYIEVLRRCKMTSRLREARQAMHEAFPLTEALWFDWLSDEIEDLSDAEDVQRIEELMEEAVRDYLSIPLWVQYLEFVRDFDPEVQAGSKEGQAKMRDLCERALTAGGLHVAEGGRLWDAYRGYEQALLEASPGDEEQVERVRALWARQLQVPLAGGPDTLAAYEAWERSRPGSSEGWQVPAALRAGYERAQHAAELRQPYETSVAPGRPADADLLASYMAYIKVEERHGDPARVQVLYERAVAAFPVTHYLWAQYARYLEAHLKIGSVINSVYSRAVRNCTWMGQLWGRALRALERSNAPDEQHAAMYNRALGAGLQTYEDYMEVILARADCLRRRGADALPALRAAFARASELLHSYFPEHLDRTFRLTSYWADCEAGAGGDLKAARAVWEAALKGAAGRYADTWAAYVDFERRRGHTREARTLYKRCYSRRLEEGGQAIVCDAWLRFEREEGSAEDHLAASLKVEPILQELQAAATAAADPQQHAVAKSAAAQAPQLSKEEVRAMRQKADPNYGKRKQQQEDAPAAAAAAKAGGGGGGSGDMPPPPAKKPRKAAPEAAAPAVVAAAQTSGQGAAAVAGGSAEPQSAPQQQEEKPAAQGEQQAGKEDQQQKGEQEPAGAAASEPEMQRREQQQRAAQQQQHQQQHPHAAPHQRRGPGGVEWRQQRRTDANTAFVKHLADGVDEAALQELFGGCGSITGIELGRDKQTGRIKGFAYIHFGSHEALEAACQLDRAEYRGKHIFVAPSKPPAAQGGQEHHQQQAGQQGHQHVGEGRGAGPGRGGGGREGGGRGRGGGRDGGRGGRDGGRGRSGRGGRGGPAPGPKHRSMIDLGDQPAGGEGSRQPAGGLRGFLPRAAVLGGQQSKQQRQQQQQKQQAGDGASAAGGDAPKSNADFRAMFLRK